MSVFSTSAGRRWSEAEPEGGTGGAAVSGVGGRYSLKSADDDHRTFQTWPDILIKHGKQVVHIIDTKWKRIAAQIDDPKQGVSQADVDQMMAYGQVYGCPKLTLLYPHHADLQRDTPLGKVHRIGNTDAHLTFASLALGSPADAAGNPAPACLPPEGRRRCWQAASPRKC